MNEKKCFHCGLDVPENIHLNIRYEKREEPACCAGCQAVAQSIIDAGLGHYYKQRTAEAEKAALPPPEILEQLKLYDLPQMQADFVETLSGSEREAVLMLGGITCAACVWLIEQQLLRLDGVLRVDLNYSTHRMRVAWDNDRVALSDILLRVQNTGYTAAPYDAQKFEQQAQKERKQSLIRLAVAGLGMMQTMMFAIPTYLYNDIEPQYLALLHWGALLMVLPVMFYSAVPFYKGTWRDLKNRRVGMDTPVAIALILTFIAGLYALLNNAGQGMYFESLAMFVFFLLAGRYMEQIARRKAGDAAERLVKLVPAFCHRLPDYPASEASEEAAVVQLSAGDILAVRLSREGGLLFAPALARPRQFVLRDCSGALRDRVYRALLAAWPIAQAAPANSGDQRVYRLELDVATRDSALWALKYTPFQELSQRQPAIALELTLACAAVVVRRLNHTTLRVAVT